MVGLLLLPLALLAGGLFALWHSAVLQHAVLAHVPGLTLEQPQGRLVGGAFSARRLQWTAPGWTLSVDGLRWDAAEWIWRPHPDTLLGLNLQAPRADRVDWQPTGTADPPASPLLVLAPLQLPLRLQLSGLRVDEAVFDGQALLHELQADVVLGAGGGHLHRIEQLKLRHEAVQIQAEATLSSVDAWPLTLSASLGPTPGAAAELPWQLQVLAQGSVAALQLKADLQAAGGASARLEAALQPLQAWPWPALGAASLQLAALDLSALQPGWPRTALSGQVELVPPERAATQGVAGTVAASVQVRNAAPGPWRAGRLPLRVLAAELRADADDPLHLVLQGFQVEWADAGARGEAGAAGRLSGQGRWHERHLQLSLDLQGIQPHRWLGPSDELQPAVSLGGHVRLDLHGLAVPGSPAVPAGPSLPPSGLQATTVLDLQARSLDRPVPPLRLQAAAEGALSPDGAWRLAVQRLRLTPAGTSAGSGVQAEGQLERSAQGRLRLRSQGRVQDLHPARWWPAAAAWPGDDPRLSARWELDLSPRAEPGPPRWQSLQGQAALTLEPSRWAGLPWTAQVRLQADAVAGQFEGQVQAGGNAVGASADWTAATPQDGRVEFRLQLADLAQLAPLQRLWSEAAPELAPWWPHQGTVDGSVAVAVAGVAALPQRLDSDAARRDRVAWPTLNTQGRLRISGLRAEALQLDRAEAHWSLSSEGLVSPATTTQAGPTAEAAARPQALEVRLQGLRGADPHGPRLTQLQAALSGPWSSHRWQLRLDSPVRPPAWMDAASPGGAISGSERGSVFIGEGGGAWQAAIDGGGRWQADVGTLRWQDAGQGPPAEPAWVQAQDLKAVLTLGPDGALKALSLQPGRARAWGVGLQWQEAEWQAAARAEEQPRLRLSASMDPVSVAPWLQRLQPGLDWAGDLSVSGQVQLDAGEQFAAQAQWQRVDGDLSLRIEEARRALEIDDLRLALSAREGQWELTQALVGRSVGVVGGLQRLQTSPQAWWPAAETPLDGGLSLLVPRLAVWAPWLPVGWQLGGSLRVGAGLSGSLGRPVLVGSMDGEGLMIRNRLQGVALQQGELAVRLADGRAWIDRLAFADGTGAGRLVMQGEALLTQQPSLRLTTQAQHLRVLDRFDRRLTLTGETTLALSGTSLRVDGNLVVDNGVFDISQSDAPALAADVTVRGRRPQAVAPASGPATQAAPGLNPILNLRLDLGPSLRVRGRGLDAALRGQLRLSSPQARLALDGTVRVEEGTYRAYGQNLRIERGRVSFRGPIETPALDILAVRADVDTAVGVQVSGSAAKPRVRLYSAEGLDDRDTLTWLLLGRAPDGLGRDDSALLQRAALALFEGEGSQGPGLLERLGLDQFSLSRSGEGDGADTVLSVGKQVSQRLYVGYEHALGAAGGTWQLIYRIVGRLTLRARTGAENAVDALWSWRWN